LIYNTANRVVIYGWLQTNGTAIQPMANVHADSYMDYSHGIRLVQNTCVLNGNTATTIQSILESSTLNTILSDEGVISQPRYPYGTILATPQSFALKKNSSTSLKLIMKNDSSATHYTIYKSTDGITFSSPVLRTKNSLTLSGLTSNQLYFVKISSYDSVHSYASGISEVLAAVPTAQNDSVLLVNGFDRVVAGNTYDFVRQHGNSFFNNNKSVESCTNEAVTDSLVQLSDYSVVDWILGEESSATETFSNAEQNFVSSYLQKGGYFFTSGSEIGWDLDHLGAASDKQFYNNFLKASYVADAPNNTAGSCYNNVMQPLSNSIFPFPDTVKFDDGTHGTYNVSYPDVIAPLNGSASDLHYTTSANDVACVHFAGMFSGGTKTGKLVYLAYPFETIYNLLQRDTVMKYILKFFFGSTATTGINNFDGGKFSVYPNPSSGEINISLRKSSDENMLIELFEITGRSMIKKEIPPSQTISLDVSECSNGIYLLRINSSGSVATRLITISK
ncbi:MAG TPA: T9SS type A sorting domain-containing protein, partial [Bacteroidia bacterium]